MSEKELKRNWSKYNEHLVQRGEILLDCLQGWQQELLRMNRGKNGRPCGYPHRLILFLGTLRVVFHLPYRQGLARGLKKLVELPAPDYSTLSLRLPKLDFSGGDEPQEGEPLAVDATGIKVTNRGEWMRRKRKGYVKIHVAVDTKTKRAVSLEVSDEGTHDSERLQPGVRQAQRRAKVAKALGDGGYDTKANFAFLAADDARAALESVGVQSFDRVGSGSNPGDLTSGGRVRCIMGSKVEAGGGTLFNKALRLHQPPALRAAVAGNPVADDLRSGWEQIPDIALPHRGWVCQLFPTVGTGSEL